MSETSQEKQLAVQYMVKMEKYTYVDSEKHNKYKEKIDEDIIKSDQSNESNYFGPAEGCITEEIIGTMNNSGFITRCIEKYMKNEDYLQNRKESSEIISKIIHKLIDETTYNYIVIGIPVYKCIVF